MDDPLDSLELKVAVSTSICLAEGLHLNLDLRNVFCVLPSSKRRDYL